MQAAFADVGAIGTHTLWDVETHTTAMLTHAHIFFTPTRTIRHGCHGKCTPEIQPEKLAPPQASRLSELCNIVSEGTAIQ